MFMDPAEAKFLLAVAATSCACHTLLLILWRRFAHVVVPALLASRSSDDKIYIENSFVTLFGVSLFAPAFAIRAILGTNMSSPLASPTSSAIVAEGISLGYMIYDLVWMLYHPEHDAKARPIMLFHHILSIIGFPYAILRHRAVPFVLFFIATEVTGILQHARMLLLKFGLDHTHIYLVVGLSWTLSFFAVRALPAPFLIMAQLQDADAWASYSAFDYWLSVTTLPLPFLLNAYWLYLLVAGAVKALRKQQTGPSPQSQDYGQLVEPPVTGEAT